ncbi:ubiquinol-cytochrome-c reductase complex subunit-domain-containing protein [Xylariomycetidae sp. FL0641]|nr:ubiquinol-cytochrome-c reductase complex subunit-domain-containing protein [Xylariomycetidae sp. FL0641]
MASLGPYNRLYQSPYGPKYHVQPNVAGITPTQATRLGFKAGAFGGVALFAVIYYASGIPRVKKDILQKLPAIGGYFVDEIPPSDNPF